MKNWIHFLACSRAAGNFVRHCLGISDSSLSSASFPKAGHMSTCPCFGGTPTKTQNPCRPLNKKSGEERASVHAAVGQGLGPRQKGSEGGELVTRRKRASSAGKGGEKFLRNPGDSLACTSERSTNCSQPATVPGGRFLRGNGKAGLSCVNKHQISELTFFFPFSVCRISFPVHMTLMYSELLSF